MSGTVVIQSGSESNLLSAVANVGPVSVAVDGSSNAFRVRRSRALLCNSGYECMVVACGSL